MDTSHPPMTHAEVRDFLSRHQDRPLSNKVLHAHPSPAFWTEDADRAALEASWLAQARQPTQVNLYFSIPFCLPTDPPHCGFCLFPTEDYRGKTASQAYLVQLGQEVALPRHVHAGSQLESLYVGGGTPNLLNPEDYAILIGLAETLFPGQTTGIEKTLEGIPQLFSEAKIRAIRAAGFNRISMGVQQLTERLIRYSGRKQTNRQVFDTIESCARHGLACNIDLIYAWPEQTVSDMLAGLQAIVASGIHHITHYELNIAGRSDFALRQRDKVPPVARKLEMYLEAQAYLRSEGFVQRTVYDWERPDTQALDSGLQASECRYEQNLRDGMDPDQPDARRYMCGFGHAAVNVRAHRAGTGVPSISTMNHRSLSRYAQALQQGELPIERFYVHDEEDLRLLWLFQALQEMTVDLRKCRRGFGRDFLSDFGAEAQVLAERGWAGVQEERWVLSRTGGYHVPLIQALLAHRRVTALQQQSARMTRPANTIPIHPVTSCAG